MRILIIIIVILVVIVLLIAIVLSWNIRGTVEPELRKIIPSTKKELRSRGFAMTEFGCRPLSSQQIRCFKVIEQRNKLP